MIRPLVAYFAGIAALTVAPGIAQASPGECSPALWSHPPTPYASKVASGPALDSLRELAKRLQGWEPQPVPTLRSAGVTDKSDPLLTTTRRAFQDADAAALLALAYALFADDAYLAATRRILLAWTQTNLPTGHPIDETRLEGLVWAYDLIACKLEDRDSAAIEAWLAEVREKKARWRFGPRSQNNNHRTHHLKMMILIDKVLRDEPAIRQHREEVMHHLAVNLPDASGESLDYRERNALHYHVFDLEAWLEIELQLRCCQLPIDRAFQFLASRIKTGAITGEFENSSAPIDAKRADAGFAYAERGGTYDVQQASRAIAVYYTLEQAGPDATLWSITDEERGSRNQLFYFARRDAWTSQR